ncbi:MAG: peptide chain release factor N(5)-glutamine methyltransferase [Clostridiales bacterium]|nr:peptide chain release factor N(5)-glutamine methyltransferase [Clostridiales bacterium]
MPEAMGQAQAGVAQTLRAVRSALLPAAGEEAALQARIIVARALCREVTALPGYMDAALDAAQLRWIEEAVKRRLGREPLQYILGEWAFMGLPFFVRPGVLIPRADTETLARCALTLARENGYTNALDLCCGTGCVAITLAKLGGLGVDAADISIRALALTRKNARRSGVTIKVIHSDWFAQLKGTYDMICINPPYLCEDDMKNLQPELRYEPALALFGGCDGLDAYRAIREAYARHLNPGGGLLLEIGATQGAQVSALFGGGQVARDYGGLPRVFVMGGGAWDIESQTR